MKESILAGAANSAGVQSTDNQPCGYTKGSDRHGPRRDNSRFDQVVISNCDRDPKSVKNNLIGLNSDQVLKK